MVRKFVGFVVALFAVSMISVSAMAAGQAEKSTAPAAKSAAKSVASTAPEFSWAVKGTTAASTAAPSAKYFSRMVKYLAPIKLTAEQTAKLADLEKKAAVDIDDEYTHANAVKAFHSTVIAGLTADQQAALKVAHARGSKGSTGSKDGTGSGSDE